MMSHKLHLIEPTLFDQTGHGFSYVQSLVRANSSFNFDLHVWLDKRGHNLLSSALCKTHAYFFRPLRQAQKIFLYWHLIKKPGTIFVCTSDLWDLKLLAFYKRFFKAPAKVFLHFHQFKQTARKLQALQKIAANNIDINILTPTAKLTQIFNKQNFTNAVTMPCPTFTPARNQNPGNPEFNKVLYAGAARADKGFALVIKLLQHLRANNVTLPFAIQISAPNSQRYDAASTAALQQLQTISKNNLTLYASTLDQTQYQSLFNNAICLLLYDQKSYHDKFSGIALDAFYAGCPIVTVKDTWMGDTAEKYAAGVALDNLDLNIIHAAIEKIISNYAFYYNNARQAALELSALHDPKNTLAYLNL